MSVHCLLLANNSWTLAMEEARLRLCFTGVGKDCFQKRPRVAKAMPSRDATPRKDFSKHNKFYKSCASARDSRFAVVPTSDVKKRATEIVTFLVSW